ncbi:hypothetical protein HDU76_013919 [Blyttiomyces sp. JEL0837]|nr:hypothetical protein HDU76_013919 [Blyttiomyces sp. JEL0837]
MSPTKPATKATLFLLLSYLTTQVQSHGALTFPTPRFGKQFDNNDHQRQPIHLRANLFPAGTSMLPCGGVTKDQSKVQPTEVAPGQVLNVAWEMGFWTGAALHQGWVTVSISNGEKDAGPWVQLNTISLVGDSTVATTPHGFPITIPSNLNVGEFATLQWNWTGSVTPEIYYNCADLVMSKTPNTTPAATGGPTTGTNTGGSALINLAGSKESTSNSNSTANSHPAALLSDPTVVGSTCDQKVDQYKCVGAHFAQCTASNVWVVEECSSNTHCESTGNGQIICADGPLPSSAANNLVADTTATTVTPTPTAGQGECIVTVSANAGGRVTATAVPVMLVSACPSVSTVTVTATMPCPATPVVRRKRDDEL